MSFIHLRVHSQYSILKATPSVKQLVQKAKDCGMEALALTDLGNLYGAVEFFKACKTLAIKPIIGCELYFSSTPRDQKNKERGRPVAHPIICLSKNYQGYRNIIKLSSRGFLEGFYYYPRIDEELLRLYFSDQIVLEGGIGSYPGYLLDKGDKEGCFEYLKQRKELFKENYYILLERHPMDDLLLKEGGFYSESWRLQRYHEYIEQQNKLNEALKEFAEKLEIKRVATNDVHYLSQEDWVLQEILSNVQSGEPCEIVNYEHGSAVRQKNPKRKCKATNALYFKTAKEMCELFSDDKEALQNSLEIAHLCHIELDFKTKHYPLYTPKHLEHKEVSDEERSKECERYLQALCKEGIDRRYDEESLQAIKARYPSQDPLKMVKERLQKELDVIFSSKGMCDYLLIVWDFIHWAKSQSIPVGPGRGSGAGSIILYLIGITEIEPLRFDLFFERFINPERLSYPDIDVDICMDRRSEVIEYTLQKYGTDSVAQIITFGTMKARMTIKDVGRVLSVSLQKVNDIVKLVPDELSITLKDALEKDADLRAMAESDEEAGRILEIGQKIEGSIRSTGIHAAGIIIGGRPLTEDIPVCLAKDSHIPATQFSMKPVEEVGMLKVDFLGLTTLTSIQYAVDAVFERSGKKIDWMNLPLNDPKSFELLNSGQTSSIFQLESAGMQDLARKLHLDRFEEIIAVGALYRPGPMEMIPSFIDRKHGRENIEYQHPWLEDILSETYGIMVYQEQVMQIATKLAGYSLGEGDVLRRAMGKKEMDKMREQRQKFKDGALEKGIEAHISEAIFDSMEKFASYGFNKSHATAYGYLSYVTAFLKSNYPKEWFSALMSCDLNDLSKVGKHIRELRHLGINILLPDINESTKRFTPTDEGIRFALSAIRGVGSQVVENIVEERENNGKYESLLDFLQRVAGKRCGKKVIEQLIAAGAFDFTKSDRLAMEEALPKMYAYAEKKRKESEKGIVDFFSHMDKQDITPNFVPQAGSKKAHAFFCLREKELLGSFLTGHPTSEQLPLMSKLGCRPITRVFEDPGASIARVFFFIEKIQTRISQRSGKKFAILQVSDEDGTQELPIWPELFEEKKDQLCENTIDVAVITLDRDGERIRASVQAIYPIEGEKERLRRLLDDSYDRAKLNQNRFFKKKQNANNASKPIESMQNRVHPEKPAKEQKKLIILELNLQSLTLNEILELKKTIFSYASEDDEGAILLLHFKINDRIEASLQLSTQKIKTGNELIKTLEGMKSSLNVYEEHS